MGTKLGSYFEQGLYEKLLSQTLDSESTSYLEDLIWQMAALLFQGDWERGHAIYKKISQLTDDLSTLSPDLKVRLFYFQGLAALRRSSYKKASRFFRAALDLKKSHKLSEDSLFFVNQGPALFHYFQGHFAKAKTWGERAFAAAEFAGNDWGELLSRDLLAHAYFHLGQVRRSQEYFKYGLGLARKIRNDALAAAIQISSLKYAARAGLESANVSILNLEVGLRNLDAHDSYSRIELLLELARQKSLAGKQNQAEEDLKTALPLVHGFQNKRQMARLNFRLAHIEYLKGRDLSALGLLRSGQALLEERVDLSVLEEFQGLEKKILGETSETETNEPHSSYWDQRIRAREKKQPSPIPKGEDPLGDILDLVHHDSPRALRELLTQGYLGLLPQILNLKRGQDAILIGLSPKGVALISEGQVEIHEKGLTALLGKILMSLAAGPQSRQNLIQSIWGYSYESTRHDPLLFKAMGSLRKLLSPFEDWIQFDAEVYSLRRGLQILSFDNNFVEVQMNSETSIVSKTTPVSMKEAAIDGRLNHRQNLFLQSWPRHKPIGIDEYALRFKISKASATRDLTGLLDNSYVLRLGKARATKYIR